jgi:hypothetical protein
LSAACPESARVRSLLARRADDSISAVETRALKAHLLACASCANEAAAEDPTLLFVPLSTSAEGRLSRRGERQREQESASLRADADRVVADVLAAVEVERSRRRLEAVPRLKQRRALLAASVALVGAGLIGFLSLRKSAPVASLSVAEHVATPLEAHAAPASRATGTAAGISPAPSARPIIEDLANPGATVYEFASASPQEPTVVFIVDRNADI